MHGEVHCRVPKLGKDKQFSIATPDAQVIVHGTVFSVARQRLELAHDLRARRRRPGRGAPRRRTRVPRPEQAMGLRDERTRAAARARSQPTRAPLAVPRAALAARARSRGPSTRSTPLRHPGRANRALDRTPEGTLDEENRILAAGARRRTRRRPGASARVLRATAGQAPELAAGARSAPRPGARALDLSHQIDHIDRGTVVGVPG